MTQIRELKKVCEFCQQEFFIRPNQSEWAFADHLSARQMKQRFCSKLCANRNHASMRRLKWGVKPRGT